MGRRLFAVLAALLIAAPVHAQRTAEGLTIASPILRVDREQLFLQSQFGQRVARELDAATQALAEENNRIDAALLDEEKALTEQRKTLSPEEFRDLANAFDNKVVGIRQAQDAKSRELKGIVEAAQSRFFQRTVPVLSALMQEAGAVVILDSRVVLLSSSSIDITALAIARINAAIGDGTGGQDDTGD